MMGQANDKVVIELQNILACKKAELINIKPAYKTNMQFRFYAGGPVINLHTVVDVSTLIRMHGVIRGQMADYLASVQDLGIKNAPPFMWENFSHADWYNDIKTKLDIIDYQARKAEYEALERRLAALESDDLKTSKELEAIMALLDK